MKRVAIVLAAAAILPTGCGPRTAPPDGVHTRLFDASGGTTFRNHVKPVDDPTGSARRVFVTSDKYKKMTFENGKGFFKMPAGHSGRLGLRLYVRGAYRLRVAVVGEKKHKSFYRAVPAEGAWFWLHLPLGEAKDRIAEGEKVKDITIWLKPSEKGGKLPPEALLYLHYAALFR